jgi:mercuric ion binding protein
MTSVFKKSGLVIILLVFFGTSAFAQSRRAKATIKTSAECEFCKKSIEKNIAAVKGIRKVSCDYKKHEVYVTYNAKVVTIEDIRKAMNDLGYDADGQPASNLKSNQIKHNKTQ